ncbi:hypothetical protein ACTI_44210 [Actinoplanes sp. OR16]|nr:hypothetical protein ACTI_44210 [Actinoplanes sp. OR16]
MNPEERRIGAENAKTAPRDAPGGGGIEPQPHSLHVQPGGDVFGDLPDSPVHSSARSTQPQPDRRHFVDIGLLDTFAYLVA